MLPRRALKMLAAAACFVAALASIDLGVRAVISALTDQVTTVDASEEIRDELPEEHAGPVDTAGVRALPRRPLAGTIAAPASSGPRNAHLRDVHRPPEA